MGNDIICGNDGFFVVATIAGVVVVIRCHDNEQLRSLVVVVIGYGSWAIIWSQGRTWALEQGIELSGIWDAWTTCQGCRSEALLSGVGEQSVCPKK